MCIFVLVFFFFLSSLSFSLPMHPNMGWVCCWLSSLFRENFIRMFRFLAECGRRRASWYATTKIIFILHLHLYIFHWIACTNLQNTWLQGSSWVCLKTQIFLVEILRREFFSMFMRKVILKAVRSTSIQLQKIYQVYFRLPFEYRKFSWRGSDEVIIRTRYNQGKE